MIATSDTILRDSAAAEAPVLMQVAGLAKRYGEVLSGHDPTIFSTTLGSRGTRPFYQVRLGAEARASAEGLCGKIRRAGGACLVLRNARAAG